jgi:hypothetical protein
MPSDSWYSCSPSARRIPERRSHNARIADKCDREPHLRPSAFATNWNGRSIG